MNKTIKCIIAVLLAVTCLFAAVACAPASSSEPDNTPAPSSETTDPTTSPESTPTSEPTPTPEPTPLPDDKVPSPVLKPIVQPTADENGVVNLTSLIQKTTIRSLEDWVDSSKPNRLFNGESDSRMFYDKGLPLTVVFAAPVPIKITDYDFITDLTNDEAGNNRPVTWKLYGANLSNYTDQVLIDEQTNFATAAGHLEHSAKIALANPEYYQFYKIEFLANAGNTDIYELNGITLYGKDGDCVGDYVKFNSDISEYAVVNSWINPKMCMAIPNYQSVQVKDFFDGDLETHAWVNLQYAREQVDDQGNPLYPYVDFMFAFRVPTTFDAYRFTLIDGYSTPVTWNIYGTDDKKWMDDPDNTLTLLDQHENEPMPCYSYAESDVFTMQNKGDYKYYVLRVFDDEFGNDENCTCPDLAELTILVKK